VAAVGSNSDLPVRENGQSHPLDWPVLRSSLIHDCWCAWMDVQQASLFKMESYELALV
jgi:hypothetical protein